MDDPYYQYPSSYYPPQPPPPPPPPGTTSQGPPPPTVVQPLPIPQYHPHQPPPPPPIPAYATPIYEQQHSHDELRTLFVAGLPADVKPREIYNLFREFPGYESSHLRSPTSNTQPFAFAVFADQHSALMAMYELNGMVFDLEKESTLYINLAKSNSKSKRLRTADDGRPVSEKRIKGSAAISWNSDSGVGSVHMPGMGNPAYNMIGYPPTQSQGRFDGRFVNEATNKRSADPCPTLFVANLGQNCSEQELIQVFSRCQGFLKLKMQSTYGAPVAFVDFQDTASSTEALSHLQGTILYSSPSGEGMRLEYAKSRMGKRSKKSS